MIFLRNNGIGILLPDLSGLNVILNVLCGSIKRLRTWVQYLRHQSGFLSAVLHRLQQETIR